MSTALALLELHSIAVGIEAADAMAKRVPLELFTLGTAQPGKLLIAAGGDVASVEEAWSAGRDTGGRALAGEVFLPDLHPQVLAAFAGPQRDFAGEALGVLETTTVTATLLGADRALKGTDVGLGEFRLADGLGGKGYALFHGEVGAVSAALEQASEAIAEAEIVGRVVVPQLHAEVARSLTTAPGFAEQWTDGRSPTTGAAPRRRARR